MLQEAPAPESRASGSGETNEQSLHLLPISARSDEALKEVAAKYAFSLASKTDSRSIADFFYTASCRRVHHTHRAAVLAPSLDTLRERLQQFSEGAAVEHLSSDLSDENRARKLVFVYTGMGPQWWAMGRELMETEPIFKDSIQECDKEFHKQAGWSILEELLADEAESRMGRTEVAQPANFAIQVGLTALWKSWGIEPHAVVGHSVGEVASAYVSGALSLEDAISVSLHRSRLQQTLAGKGSMLAAGLSEDEALTLISGYDGVSIAAINSPSSVTLSGEEAQLETIEGILESEGKFNRKLQVEVAYHSGQMDPIESSILKALNHIAPVKSRIPFISTVVGERLEGPELGADYWWRNVRQPVHFLKSIIALLDDGCLDFLEIGPHPVLGHSIREIAASRNVSARLTPSLNRKVPERARMWESLGQLYTQGQAIQWDAVIPEGVGLRLYLAIPGNESVTG